jgi:hypothetical protein
MVLGWAMNGCIWLGSTAQGTFFASRGIWHGTLEPVVLRSDAQQDCIIGTSLLVSAGTKSS